MELELDYFEKSKQWWLWVFQKGPFFVPMEINFIYKCQPTLLNNLKKPPNV
jgi:hypothetical protein